MPHQFQHPDPEEANAEAISKAGHDPMIALKGLDTPGKSTFPAPKNFILNASASFSANRNTKPAFRIKILGVGNVDLPGVWDCLEGAD